MIRVEYAESFLRDLKKLKHNKIYNNIKVIAFDDLPNCKSLLEIRNLKKIQGHKSYYRIRVKSYRIGVKFENKELKLLRVVHRKDIYKQFP